MSIRLDIITIFPQIFSARGGSAFGGDSCGYFDHSMIKRAREKKLVEIKIHDLRAFTKDKHRKIDQKPYGGGPGMLLQIEPLARALASIKKHAVSSKRKIPVILFSAGGTQFTSKQAIEWSKKYKHIVMIAGHYEGIDERVKSLIRDTGYLLLEVSIGPYVLTGGEIPAMVIVDAVARHIPGVLGKHESLEENRLGVGVPMYTRPEIFVWPDSRRGKKGKKYKVPPVLLSGDHKKIEEWRKKKKPR